MRLSTRQEKILTRLRKKGGSDFVSPDVAKQLSKKGLVRITGNIYFRTEWNRRVKNTTLWEIELCQ